MLFGADPGMILLSERAVNVFTQSGITGFIPHKVNIIPTKAKNKDDLSYDAKPDELSNANYYVLEVTGKGRRDFKKMGVELLIDCEYCGATKIKDDTYFYPEVFIDEATWDGSDIFNRNYCTVKVLETVYKNQLTGFEFRYSIDSGNALEQRKVDLKALFGNHTKGNRNR